MVKPNELTFKERQVNGITRVDVFYPNELPQRSMFNRLILAMEKWGAAAAYAIHR